MEKNTLLSLAESSLDPYALYRQPLFAKSHDVWCRCTLLAIRGTVLVKKGSLIILITAGGTHICFCSIYSTSAHRAHPQHHQVLKTCVIWNSRTSWVVKSNILTFFGPNCFYIAQYIMSEEVKEYLIWFLLELIKRCFGLVKKLVKPIPNLFKYFHSH